MIFTTGEQTQNGFGITTKKQYLDANQYGTDIHKFTDEEFLQYNNLCKKEDLEKQLSDLKANAILPKFYYGASCYVFSAKNKIVKATIEDISVMFKNPTSCYLTYQIKDCKGNTHWAVKDNEVFTTQALAEEALKLEGK